MSDGLCALFVEIPSQVSQKSFELFWSGLECRTHDFRFSCKQKMTGAISSHLALVTVLWVELAAERHWKTYPRKFLLLETAGQVISGTFPMETFKTIHKYVTQHWSDAYVPIIRLLPDYNSRRMSQFCIVMLHLTIQPCLKGTINCWCSHSVRTACKVQPVTLF